MAYTIEISDDDGEKNPPPRTKTLGKRKPSPDSEEKVAWSDDDDSNPNQQPKRRRATRRKTTAKGKKPAGKSAAKKAATDPRASPKDEYEEACMPDYLLQRRKAFDTGRELLKDAGLKLPPDYADIYFSDDELAPNPREERPKFDERSGIKPCRPYKDVELEYSAGVIPASIAQYLRDYQIDGVKFLHQRFVYQKGCILGDDMGLGKTVQVAAFLAAAFGKTGDERDAKRMRKIRRAGDQWYPRVLIVCPGSLIQNWRNELNRWGWWHVDVYHGPGKQDVLHTARSGRLEIMITTYVTYKNTHEAVNEVEWDCVVADECHVLKDRRSETTQAMDCVNALCRIGLTGTAIQNKYEELWTLLNWTNPGHFGTLAEWGHTITKPLTVGQSHDATLKQLSVARMTARKLVQNLLPDFFLRRMKTLIAHQLPKKRDKVVFCPLTDIQRDAYENFLEGPPVTAITSAPVPCSCNSGRKRGWCCYKLLPDGKPWNAVVFPSIMTLQKISNHLTLLIPSSSDPSDKQQSELETLQTCVPDDWDELYRNRDSMLNLANPEFCGKWKILRKLLRLWHESGDKVLVFSHSVRLLRILQHLFHNTSYNVSFLDGSRTYEDRQRVVDDFNADPAQFVFLISTKAGGVGLNITSANKVVIFDPHWNPSYDLQAQDRAYRIGQVRDVDVFRLVSAGTVEEIVYARQIYKQQQANIGYNASSERRYFKGVQQDSNRRGEIFGLGNLFSFHGDQVVLREIVNKTNVAEAKAGVHLGDIDLERMMVKDGEDDDDDALTNFIKQEPGGEDDPEAGGMSQLAKLLTAENQEELLQAHRQQRPRSDAVAAILASTGVEYTHEHSEVIGTSRVEAQLSRRAELVAAGGSGVGAIIGGEEEEMEDDDGYDFDLERSSSSSSAALFADRQANHVAPLRRQQQHLPAGVGGGDGSAANPWRMHYKFNPPADVLRRQFCSMARGFGFASATDFALVVESWTQEQRRNCLDSFYRLREVRVLEGGLARMRKVEEEEGGKVEGGVKGEMKEVKGEVDIEKKGLEDGMVGKTEGEDGGVRVKEENSGTPSHPRPSPLMQVKTEKTQVKRVSTIFLSDDEEDDEL